MDKILRGYYETPEIAVIPIRPEGVVCLSDVTVESKAKFTGFGEEEDWSN